MECGHHVVLVPHLVEVAGVADMGMVLQGAGAPRLGALALVQKPVVAECLSHMAQAHTLAPLAGTC